MGRKLKSFGFGLVVTGFTAGAAIGEMSYAEFAQDPTDTKATLFLQGISIGLSWANTDLGYREQPLLYCEPGDLEVSASESAAILQSYMVGATTEQKGWPIGLLLLFAFQQKFPC